VLDLVLDYLTDYTGPEPKTLLVVEPDVARRERVLSCVEADDLQVQAVTTGAEALRTLGERRVDCVVLGSSAQDLADELLARDGPTEPPMTRLPVVVYDDGAPAEDTAGAWKRLANVCTVRRVHSPERLLDQTLFFLHRRVSQLPEARR